MNTEHNDIKFSVIIPAYNAGQTIARAIDSVLDQSYHAHEIIVVNDASTDNTLNILEGYGNKIRIIQNTTNKGGSISRNEGIDIVTGDYIAFLDADDMWHKDKLMLLNAILSANLQIKLFYHPYTQDDIAKKRLPEDIKIYKLPFIKLLPANPIATSCAVISANLAFRFDTSMRYTEDYDLWLRIGYKYKVYFIDIPLTSIFRPFTTKGGISENKWKMRRGEMRAYLKLVLLNPLFVLLTPFLLVSSMGKHLYKIIFNTNK